MSGIYVASRASIPERPQLWRDLRRFGWPLVSTWIDEAGEGETDDFSELWARIENEVREADMLVLYAEPGDFPLKGSLVEVGMALGMGKPVCVVAPGVEVCERTARPLGSWIKSTRVSLVGTLAEALREWDIKWRTS